MPRRPPLPKKRGNASLLLPRERVREAQAATIPTGARSIDGIWARLDHASRSLAPRRRRGSAF